MNSENAVYTGFEFVVDGYPALAVINTDLKNLPDRSLYPYSVFIEIVPDSFNEIGQPVGNEYDYLLEIEKRIIQYLETETRSLHIGHTTLFRRREIIFYTKDSALVEDFLEHYLNTIERENTYEIEEDREWDNVSAFYNLL